MKPLSATVALILLLMPIGAHAHGTKEEVTQISFLEPVNSVLYALIIVFVCLVISIILKERLGSKSKKALFALIAVPVIFSTVYLAASTVYINIASESNGPVHWHADFEIWICGEKVLLMEPHGFDNKVGSAVLHHHNEGIDLNGTYRMHVEGVLLKLEEANLEHFFEETGNLLAEDSIGLFLMDGSQKRWINEQECQNTGQKGQLKVFVNGKQIETFTEYVIKPFSNVPPGDFIKFVFE